MKDEITEHWHRIKAAIWKNCITEVKGSRKIICLLKAVFILEISALIADLCPVDYWFDWIEKIVTYNVPNVIPVVAILWGAVAIPMGFLLGQIERRNYGIRLVDFIIASVGMDYSVFLIVSFWLQLVFIILSVTYSMPVLLTVVIWTQLLYLFYSFYLVILSISSETIQNLISEQSKGICENSESKSKDILKELHNKKLKEQNDILIKYSDVVGIRHWLLLDMIKNLNYDRLEDVEILERILIEVVCPKLKGIAGRKIAYDLFKTMISVAAEKAIIRVSYNVFSANISIDARKGILAALISERESDYYRHCNNLIDKLEDCDVENDSLEKIFIWEILWSIYQRVFIMNPIEKLQNDAFIDSLQKTLKEKKINFVNYGEGVFDEIILQSCLDFMMLTQVNAAEKIVIQIFENKIEF